MGFSNKLCFLAFACITWLFPGVMVQRFGIVEWIDASDATVDQVEPGGIENWLYPGGDWINHTAYVARALLQVNGFTARYPGKLTNFSEGFMYYSLNGSEHRSTDYQVLKFPHGAASWTRVASDIATMKNLILGGNTLENDPYYICRISRSAEVLPTGKVGNDGVCSIPFASREYTSDAGYEVLVLNDYGVAIGAGGTA